jgi:hypothetical protein
MRSALQRRRESGGLPVWDPTYMRPKGELSRMRSFVAMVFYFTLGFGMLWRAASPADAQRPGPVMEEAKFVQQVIELTNRARGKAGLLPLKPQETLCRSARWMAQDMAAHDYFDHTDDQGRGISARFKDFGYKGYHTLGENIAVGQRTPEEVVSGWLKSPGHRHNLLSPDFSEIGIGYVYVPGSRYRRYWVQDFGSRFDVYPVVINNGDAQTRSPEVRLSLYGEDWADRMRLSNDGVHWTAWQPFRAERNWSLEPESGNHTVYVELRRYNQICRSESTIHLTQESIAQEPSDSRERR